MLQALPDLIALALILLAAWALPPGPPLQPPTTAIAATSHARLAV